MTKEWELKNRNIFLKNLKIKIRFFLLKEFFHNPLVQWLSLVIAFLNIAAWVSWFVFARKMDFWPILHYNVYFGIELIGHWALAFFLPAVGVVVAFLDFLLAYFLYSKKERIGAYILLLASLLFQLGLIINLVSLMLVNH